MADKMRSMRLSDERWAWLAEEAGRRGSSRTGVVEELVDAARAGRVVGTGGAMGRPTVSGSRPSVGPTRIDSVEAARQWLGERQARLNAAKERAS